MGCFVPPAISKFFNVYDNYVLSYTAQFETEPESMVQAEGLEAVFENRYPDLQSDWIVNQVHRSSKLFPPEIKIVDETSGNPSVLTMHPCQLTL